MNRKILIAILVASALLVMASIVRNEAIGSAAVPASSRLKDQYLPPRPRLSIPVTTSGVDTGDHTAQQPGLIQQPARQVDLSAYYHYIPELNISELNWIPARQVDLSAYYHYIPELNWMPAR